MSDDSSDPTLGIAVGAIFVSILVILIIGYLFNRCNKNKKNKRDKVTPTLSSSTKVVPALPAKIKLRRRATHDPSDTQPRKIIERTQLGIELMFREFDASGDQLIDQHEVSLYLFYSCTVV